MFERYGFGGVYVAIQAVLALYAQGERLLLLPRLPTSILGAGRSERLR